MTDTNIVCGLDPGHGGYDPGALSQSGLTRESDLNLAIALEAKHKDPTLVLTRDSDRDPMFAVRRRTLVEAGVGFVVALHCDSARPRVKGLRAYYHRGNKLTRSVCQFAVDNAPVELAGGRVVDPTDSTSGARFICRVYPQPTVLIEFGFVTNEGNLAFIRSIEGIAACADLVISCCERFKTIYSGEHHGQ